MMRSVIPECTETIFTNVSIGRQLGEDDISLRDIDNSNHFFNVKCVHDWCIRMMCSSYSFSASDVANELLSC